MPSSPQGGEVVCKTTARGTVGSIPTLGTLDIYAIFRYDYIINVHLLPIGGRYDYDR